jgi:hypothetical protein
MLFECCFCERMLWLSRTPWESIVSRRIPAVLARMCNWSDAAIIHSHHQVLAHAAAVAHSRRQRAFTPKREPSLNKLLNAELHQSASRFLNSMFRVVQQAKALTRTGRMAELQLCTFAIRAKVHTLP